MSEDAVSVRMASFAINSPTEFLREAMKGYTTDVAKLERELLALRAERDDLLVLLRGVTT
jgi:hypothetical protein